MSSIRGEISQLVGPDGSRPTSNLDSFRLHSFYSNLPIYRKKYDWNVPKWTSNDLITLHNLVRSTVVSLLSTKVESNNKRLTITEKRRLLEIIDRLSSRDLYLIYLNFDLDILSVKLVDLIKGPNYSDFLKSLTNSSSSSTVVFNSFKALYSPSKPKFQDVDLSVFWDTVANSMNSNSKRTMSFKISTDCCLKFINSTSSGVLLTEVLRDDFTKITDFLSKTNTTQALKSCIENSALLGLSVYQYMIVLLHKAKTSKWDSSEDSVLMDSVNSELDFLDSTPVTGKNTGISWKDISRKIPGKNPEQCRLRYRQIKKKRLTDSPFLSREMVRLRILKSAFGKNWSKIANLMPGRSSRQCRDKVLEGTKYSRENALESLEYFRTFLSNFSTYYSNLDKPFFVGRYWKHFDWLGLYLFKVLNITRNEHLLEILKKFYFSDEIVNRIEASFKSSQTKFLVQCTGAEIYSLSSFLEALASEHDEVNFDKVMAINQTIVNHLLKRCAKGEKVDFENFDKTKNFYHLKKSVFNSLKTLWP